MVFTNVTDLSDPKNLATAIREYFHLKVCPVKSSTLPEIHQPLGGYDSDDATKPRPSFIPEYPFHLP